MALEQKLSLKLSQRLVMTPSLQQAIKLLQMTRLELEGVLTQELVENPVLEESEEQDEGEDGDEATAEAEVAETPAEAATAEDDSDKDSMDEIDYEAYFGEYLDNHEYRNSNTYEARESFPLENTLSREPDLYDHLLWQLHMSDVSGLQREIAELIIGNLNTDGFLVASLEEIQRLGCREAVGEIDPESPIEATVDAPDAGEAETAPVESPALDVTTDEPTAWSARSQSPSQDCGPSLRPLSAAATWAVAVAPPPEPTGQALQPSAELVSPQKLEGQVAAVTLHDVSLAGAIAGAEKPQEALPGSAAPADVSPATAAEPIDGYAAADVESALRFVQSLDPPGIACRDLRESLLHQLHQIDEEDSLAYQMLRDHWALFLKRQFPAIAKQIGLPLADLESAVELIRSLETRPGRQFNNDRTQYVEPDVAIVKVGDEYVIQLNDDGLPRLRVSRAYRQMLHTMKHEGRQVEAQHFIKEKMRSAIWLIKSLDQRQRTIYKVANSIIRQQRDFLDRGIDHLRPMVLRDVAEDIDMHESTVSRVVSNKYIHTPRGLFPMKFFFHSGIDRDYGEDISSLSVKRKIQQMIQAEDAKRPLSDSELMRVLNRDGINIARRTVAKYRDELGIPSSTDRKQVF